MIRIKSKVSANLAALLAVSMLTACTKEEAPNIADTTQSSQPPQSSQPAETAATEAFDEFQHKLELVPDLVPTPDGNTADISEAVEAYKSNRDNPAYTFDFGFLRYALPVFQCSLDENAFNFDTMTFNSPYSNEITDPQYFKVKAGDKLKCGLTVTKAEWDIEHQSGWGFIDRSSLIEFEGEITWEGILHRSPEDDFQIEKGDLTFYPDPVKNDGLPVQCGKYWYSEETGEPIAGLAVPVWDNGAIESGGSIIDLGNISDNEEMFNRVFDEGDLARVKMTLRNLVFENDEGGSCTYAEAVSCEIVKML